MKLLSSSFLILNRSLVCLFVGFNDVIWENSRSPFRCCYRVGRENQWECGEERWMLNDSHTVSFVCLDIKPPSRLYMQRTPTTTNWKPGGWLSRSTFSFSSFTFTWRHRKLIEIFSHEIFIAMNLNDNAGREQLWQMKFSFSTERFFGKLNWKKLYWRF